MKLSCGKYKDLDIVDVPLSYLKYVESEWDLTSQQRQDVNFEIARRSGYRPGAGRTVSREEIERKNHNR